MCGRWALGRAGDSWPRASQEPPGYSLSLHRLCCPQLPAVPVNHHLTAFPRIRCPLLSVVRLFQKITSRLHYMALITKSYPELPALRSTNQPFVVWEALSRRPDTFAICRLSWRLSKMQVYEITASSRGFYSSNLWLPWATLEAAAASWATHTPHKHSR